MVFSRTWQKLSPEDQALIKKLSKETQAEQRAWYSGERRHREDEGRRDRDHHRHRQKPPGCRRSGVSTARSAAMVKRIEAVSPSAGSPSTSGRAVSPGHPAGRFEALRSSEVKMSDPEASFPACGRCGLLTGQ
jgi:hypothetical protein